MLDLVEMDLWYSIYTILNRLSFKGLKVYYTVCIQHCSVDRYALEDLCLLHSRSAHRYVCARDAGILQDFLVADISIATQ